MLSQKRKENRIYIKLNGLKYLTSASDFKTLRGDKNAGISMEAHRLQTAVCPDCLPIPLQHIPRNPGECYQWQLYIILWMAYKVSWFVLFYLSVIRHCYCSIESVNSYSYKWFISSAWGKVMFLKEIIVGWKTENYKTDSDVCFWGFINNIYDYSP